MTRSEWLKSCDKAYVEHILRGHKTVAEAAVTAGVNRTTVYGLMREHGLSPRLLGIGDTELESPDATHRRYATDESFRLRHLLGLKPGNLSKHR